MKKIISIVCLLFAGVNLFAQYSAPLRIPLSLSANFAEFRANHYHSGIDIKTGGTVNLPVYAVERGYVSRIMVSPSGYGLAIYIDHPDGHTTVYGHLNRFVSSIQEYVQKKQYEQESFKVDLMIPKDMFPIQKGELIAYSGDTGNSGGPHLHFEIRDTRSEDLINPLLSFRNVIQDHKAPEFQALMVYPTTGSGAVNTESYPVRVGIPQSGAGKPLPFKQQINAWGQIGLGIKAIDRMDGTYNTFCVTHVRLYLDGKEIFSYLNDGYSFHQGRMYNSVIDFATWKRRNEFFLKCFVDPGNTFPFYKTVNKGYIQINEERDYNIRYELEDIYGNKSEYSFLIKGQKQEIPGPEKTPYLFAWNKDNKYANNNFSLDIPKGNLYGSFYFYGADSPSTVYYSNICRVNNFAVPLHSFCDLRVKLNNDTLSNKSQYGIVQISGRGKIWVGGKYDKGYVRAGIRELGGSYAVSEDKKAPVIIPVQTATWLKRGIIRIQVADNLSGLALVRGTIDGRFVLFENDVKSAVYSYKIDGNRIGRNKNHELVLLAKDASGNTSEYKWKFEY